MSVKYDLFPAFVAFIPATDPTPITEIGSGPPRPRDARHFDKARVIVFGDKVTIAVDGDSGPRVIFQESYTPGHFQRSADRTKDSYLTTDSGVKIAFKKNDACGCGSRLRSWNPYRTLDSTKDPTE